ncbi:nitrous oxide reductase accessory protein NosL [Haloarcula sediminis]|uniref:nitrous oxide reductase accessory protein NosL n=1 Tax=Haloarcula sediminis TaxID=3111777 RepID=UPI002D77072E|nr:nitrous oxide reductase accessory protein NosL [Haloarcula sp. CK38]
MSDRTHRPTRRRVLATATALALAGCQSGADGPETVTIGDEANCDQCGMVIADHPGPVGETYYEDNTPTGGEPALFCSTICTYRHRFQKEQEGWAPAATFLTDYSSVDYDVRTDGGATVLTHHLDASAFAGTADLTVVANSDVQGAMGAAIVPFTDSDDAEGFAEEYGGQTLPATDIRRELVSSG